jgi:Zn-dependent metalloprotease
MPMLTARLRALFCLLVLASAALVAQVPTDPARLPGPVGVYATTPNDLRAWDRAIDQMVRFNQLVVTDVRPDPDIDGRTHETLVQYHDGVRVYGGSITRQIAQGVTVSVLGNLYDGIAVEVTPSLTADRIEPALAQASGGARLSLAPATNPRLIVFPTLMGGYRLAYQATMDDAKTYIVDASSGDVLWTVDEFMTQAQVGTGTGALGDTKKLSTTSVTGGFRTEDQHRPASVRTLDTRGVGDTWTRLRVPPVTVLDSDFVIDADNTWSNPPVVDTHVHVGWMEDYFFKQVGWTGVDNTRGAIASAFHSGLVSNAQFLFPPFGPEGRGLMTFGQTPAGVPVTTLDVVGHEMMHGVTDAAFRQRFGTGMVQFLIGVAGPPSVTQAGVTLPCDTTDFLPAPNVRWPMFCTGGRYVIYAHHGGALHEGFSDVFGHAAEFFFQPTGTGTLRADYKAGEDIPGFGPIRASDAPRSLAFSSSAGPIPYPDHFTNRISHLAAITAGTRTNPQGITILPLALTGRGDEVGTAGVAPHYNSTIISHAYYLAVEGGRNSTSGITVQGVGAANRAQIERAFFRGITLLLPQGPSMQQAAQAILQGAVDLYGANSAAATAVRQAMQAVGLVN